jgi:tetratricopeptide (TPR) repeat protein
MKLDFSNWDEDLPPDISEEYENLITSLERKTGFGLFFVQCTPRDSENVIDRVISSLPAKQIQVLRLVEPIENLYQLVDDLYSSKRFDLLLIKGLEYSLYKYEERNFGEITEGQFSNLTRVPPLLSHLNQQRERFRDDFPIIFVFLLQPFAVSYLIHRSPDFFDWRSGLFELPITPEALESSSRSILEWDYEEYLKLNYQEKMVKFLEIQELLRDKNQTDTNRANLLFELATVLSSTQEYETAISAFDASLAINPNYPQTWYRRGYALGKLERHTEALASFEQAVKLQPNYHQAWFNQAIALYKLGNYIAALPFFDQAIKIKDDYFLAWFKRGVTYKDLGRYPEAIASFDQAIKINPHASEVWYATASCYAIEGDTKRAWENLQQAINLNPQDYLEKIKSNPEFTTLTNRI